MARYEVEITEIVVYRVPVEYDEEWDQYKIEDAAEDALMANPSRDRDWLSHVENRSSEYIGIWPEGH